MSSAAVTDLDAKARKRLREKARRAAQREAESAFEAQERERLAAQLTMDTGEAAPQGEAAPAGVPPSPSSAPARTDDDRARDAARFLSGVLFPLLALAALLSKLAPWRLALEEFTDAQAVEDGKAWVGVLNRYPRLDLFVTWASPFAAVVARVRAIARPKPAEAILPTPAAEERAA